MYDLIILGGGPAGCAAAVYSARKQLKTAIIATGFGGQSTVSELVYNWIGTPEISGLDLGDNLKKHVMYYKGEFLDIIEGERISKIEKSGSGFILTTESSKTYTTKTILITTGSSRRKLTVPGAEKFENKGITYCASCDGPLFSGQDVVVIGGGNAGLESAVQLVAYCNHVTILHRHENFKGDEITAKKILANPKVSAILNVEPVSIDGDQFVTSLTYKDKTTGAETILPTTGIFVEVGQIPNTNFVKDLVNVNQTGNIIVDPTNQMSSVPGIWAAGDVTDGKYHQNNIAAGDAVKALEDIYLWIHKNS